MTNDEVVSSFLQKKVAAGPISTDGEKLRSYGVVIAEWDKDEIVMPESSKFRSMTTSKHRGLVRRMATNHGIKVTQKD